MKKLLLSFLAVLSLSTVSELVDAQTYTVQGVSAAVTNTGTANLAPTMPTHATGDMICEFSGSRTDSDTLATTPSGYTLIGTSAGGGYTVYCKVATSSSEATQNIAYGASAAHIAYLVVLRSSTGWPAVASALVHGPQTGNNTTASVIYRALTGVTTDNALLIQFGGKQTTSTDGAATAVTLTSGWTAAGFGYNSAASGLVIAGQVKEQATAADIPQNTETSTGNTTNAVSRGITFVLKGNAAAAPSFSAGPTKTADGTGGNTWSATPSASATWYIGVYKKNGTCPSAANVKAGTGTGFVAVFSKAITGADTQSSTGLDYPAHLYCQVLSNGDGDSAVNSQDDIFKSPPTGYIYDTLSSVGTGSWCADYISSPAAAAGDVVELTSPTAILSKTVSVEGNCFFTFENSGARDRICARVYDDSVQDWMTISSPSAYCSGTRAAIWYNNQTPFATAPSGTVKYFFHEGQAITPVDLLSQCEDPEGDTIVVTNVDSLPAGLSISSSTLQGTPTTKGVYSNITFRCSDIVGDFLDWE